MCCRNSSRGCSRCCRRLLGSHAPRSGERNSKRCLLREGVRRSTQQHATARRSMGLDCSRWHLIARLWGCGALLSLGYAGHSTLTRPTRNCFPGTRLDADSTERNETRRNGRNATHRVRNELDASGRDATRRVRNKLDATGRDATRRYWRRRPLDTTLLNSTPLDTTGNRRDTTRDTGL